MRDRFGSIHLLNALPIGLKLAITFALVFVLVVALGAFSILNLSRVKTASDELAVKWVPTMKTAESVRDGLLAYRSFEIKYVIAADDAYRADYRRRMQSTDASVDQALAELRAVLTGGEEATMLAAFTNTLGQYRAASARVVDLAATGKAVEAKDVSDGASQRALDDAVASMDRIVEMSFDKAKQSATHANRIYEASRLWTIGLVVIVVAVGALLAALITRSVTQPLGYLRRCALQMAEGDLSESIVVDHRDVRSETSQLARAMQQMHQNISQLVAQVREKAQSVASASSEIAQGNQDLSRRTEMQASNLQQTAASMEQMTSVVRQNADNARQANQLSATASAVALRGGEAVSQVITTMESISTSSRRISDIIGVIDGIAFQTNILALNAAVEAARAGEQGRGFAVVAGEVRSLAQRSAQAAREIKSLIGESVERVEHGARIVKEAGRTMDEIVTQVRRVTDLIGEMSSSTNEQSNGIGQVNQAISQLDQTTQQNAALVEQSAAAAENLRLQSAALESSVALFKIGGGISDAAAVPAVGGVAARSEPTLATTAASDQQPAYSSAVVSDKQPLAARDNRRVAAGQSRWQPSRTRTSAASGSAKSRHVARAVTKVSDAAGSANAADAAGDWKEF